VLPSTLAITSAASFFQISSPVWRFPHHRAVCRGDFIHRPAHFSPVHCPLSTTPRFQADETVRMRQRTNDKNARKSPSALFNCLHLFLTKNSVMFSGNPEGKGCGCAFTRHPLAILIKQPYWNLTDDDEMNRHLCFPVRSAAARC
jgi:hypothetical protein